MLSFITSEWYIFCVSYIKKTSYINSWCKSVLTVADGNVECQLFFQEIYIAVKWNEWQFFDIKLYYYLSEFLIFSLHQMYGGWKSFKALQTKFLIRSFLIKKKRKFEYIVKAVKEKNSTVQELIYFIWFNQCLILPRVKLEWKIKRNFFFYG